MPVPSSVTPRTVVGTYVDGAGGLMRGTITFRVEQSLIATVESWGVNPTPITVELVNGSFSQSLLSSDDIDLFPSGFRYIVQERFQKGYIRTYSIALPAGNTNFNLPTASQYSPGNIALSTVNSINGHVGIVQLGAADVSAIPLSQRGVANGVPTLDSSGKIPLSQVPAPTAGVAMVDGRSGTVTLGDLYSATSHTHAYPVTSVNGSTGAVTVSPASISAIPLSQKGAASGVASLDSGGHLLMAQVPEQVFINVFDANSQVAMLALAADRSDLCRRTDLNKMFMLLTNDPTQLVNWVEFLNPPPPVSSVNGHTGTVALTAADVSAVATAARGAANGVASLDSSTLVPLVQIPNLPASRITSGLIDFLRLPTGTTSTTVSIGNHGHSNYIDVSGKGAPNGVASLDSTGRVPLAQMPNNLAAVSSVNGLTGLVVLAAADVGALSTVSRGSANGVASLDASVLIPSAQIPNLATTKITSGVFDIARLPTGTGINQVSLGNHTHAYVAIADKGAPNGVASLGTGGQVPIGQLPTGTSGSSVALGSHNHDAVYVALADKGVANGVASLDATGKVPAGQLPTIASVTSVNGYTGVVTLVASDVSAVPLSQKGTASGVATLDGSTLVPFAQLPTGTTSSTVAAGNHSHGSLKAIVVDYITSGNLNPLANTSTVWTEVDSTKYRRTITAAAGDAIFISVDMRIDLLASQHFDIAFLVSGSPVRYAATGTSTPADGGSQAFSHSPGTYRSTGFSRWFVLGAGDVAGGLLTITLMYNSNASGGTVYSSTTEPAIFTLVNHGPSGL